ncbi:hypothetical protein B7O87_02130 [Cylindrospermopsis raciborskii CENA303]|uniref:Uncharacterized protein n=1 Tax=Cylindrospermopsis raciborskii CENA303 TaxID=1170769 RepID=A0A1X4GBU4_9CYAN|nr:hypothetical protein B7O87_02130 [Cylindrospermopsis raciborskii CENA303]
MIVEESIWGKDFRLLCVNGKLIITRQKQNVFVQHKGVVQHLIVRSDVENFTIYFDVTSHLLPANLILN